MKHSDKAHQAALRLVLFSLAGLTALFAAGVVGFLFSRLIFSISATLIGLWVIFALFTFFFFRDPEPRVPTEKNLVVSPAHGTIDLIDQTTELSFMGGPCQRISIFLSVFNVHVQNAPVGGRIAFFKYTAGLFLNAMSSDSAIHNENLLFGIESTENPGTKIGVRLIAGLIARRIVPFVSQGDLSLRGERISLIQFGSRTDLYLPLSAKIRVKVGDKTVGGETIMAVLE